MKEGEGGKGKAKEGRRRIGGIKAERLKVGKKAIEKVERTENALELVVKADRTLPSPYRAPATGSIYSCFYPLYTHRKDHSLFHFLYSTYLNKPHRDITSSTHRAGM
ncbi:hypothetical protein APICC_01760 [Apis cerana cerana]|uniref:Uncharacterized protein n=1 Tax=Apis cerana cerana TaxID=94128 RepID=A0A2A3E187_APICC|nr:hypothetical protein APICC_01760 [Apis cerana cerana]